MSFKSQRSKATDFNKKIKMEMLERDNYRCIFCGNAYSLTPSHYVSRASGGLGIIENGACLCISCHQALDQSSDREQMMLEFQMYLGRHYPDFEDVDRIFDRREWLK